MWLAGKKHPPNYNWLSCNTGPEVFFVVHLKSTSIRWHFGIVQSGIIYKKKSGQIAIVEIATKYGTDEPWRCRWAVENSNRPNAMWQLCVFFCSFGFEKFTSAKSTIARRSVWTSENHIYTLNLNVNICPGRMQGPNWTICLQWNKKILPIVSSCIKRTASATDTIQPSEFKV